jgi:hypothetical protein
VALADGRRHFFAGMRKGIIAMMARTRFAALI